MISLVLLLVTERRKIASQKISKIAASRILTSFQGAVFFPPWSGRERSGSKGRKKERPWELGWWSYCKRVLAPDPPHPSFTSQHMDNNITATKDTSYTFHVGKL